MKDRFGDFVNAVVLSDEASGRRLLKEHPGLVRGKALEPEPRPSHWIYQGDSALHVASAWHRKPLVKGLLASGADPSLENRRGAQPLHYAADGIPDNEDWNPAHQIAVIRMLVHAGADPNARDKNGATPLHRAVRTRFSKPVRELLKAGADPNSRNKSGSTPRKLATFTTGRDGSVSDAAKKEQQLILALLK